MGTPTGDYLPAFQDQPADVREQLNREFDTLLGELQAAGELAGGEALADATGARLYRWRDGAQVATDGPYSESKEHFAGFFMIDVESQQRAEEIAQKMASPGETVELRATMQVGGPDQ